MERIEKYAILGEATVVEMLAKGADKLTGANIRYYELEEDTEAKNWVLD
ncbi:SpoIIAA family protein [Alteribacter lacisalsi]|nr:STAS/SEC14 domain-containing protein [Alteribacter lacisalsi]